MICLFFVGDGARDEATVPHLVRTIVDVEFVLREEGCLSVPGINVELRRPRAATIKAQDIKGEQFELTDHELLARVWQHEMDHLDGVLIIDKLSPMDRIATRKILKELEATAARD